MRAFLIDPAERSITEINFTGNYKAIQRIISYTEEPVLFQPVLLEPGNILYVDEEGNFKVGLSAFTLRGYPGHLVGKGLIIGYDEEDEENQDRNCSMTLEQVKDLVIFEDLQSTARFTGAPAPYVLNDPNSFYDGFTIIEGPQPVFETKKD